MSQTISGKSVLLVTAHPDDETVLATGLIRKVVETGGRVVLFCATKGGQGKAHIDFDPTTGELEAARTKELSLACESLGINQVVVGDFPDGALKEHPEALRAKLTKLIDSIETDLIVGFNIDGLTGHEDHVAMGEIGYQISKDRKIPYLAFSRPPESVCSANTFHDHLIAKRKSPFYISHFPITPEPDLAIQVDPQIKEKALGFYASQLPGLSPYSFLPGAVAQHLMSNEYFLWL